MSIVASAAVSDVGVWRHFRKSLRRDRGRCAAPLLLLLSADCRRPSAVAVPVLGAALAGRRPALARSRSSVAQRCCRLSRSGVSLIFRRVYALSPDAPPTTVGPAHASPGRPRSSSNPLDFEIRFFLLSLFISPTKLWAQTHSAVAGRQRRVSSTYVVLLFVNIITSDVCTIARLPDDRFFIVEILK